MRAISEVARAVTKGDLTRTIRVEAQGEVAALKDIINEISKGRVGATIVSNDGDKITGIITDGDIRRLLEKTDDIRNLAAADISVSNPKSILNTALAVEALEKMNTYEITQLAVIDDHENYLGIIHLHDLIREGII